MIILGLDTSGYINAVGIADGDRILANNRFPARTDTLEQIVDNIDVTLKQAGISLNEVGGIGVGLGPGSWTGIKVGVTVGKMLAYAAGKPVAGIPTLEALAYQAKASKIALLNEDSTVCSVIAAGVKDMVYAALYNVQGDEVVREDDYFAGDARKLGELVVDKVTLAGDGAEHYMELILEKDESLGVFLDAIDLQPSGASVAYLAGLRLARGQTDDPLSLTPLYLKESTARVFVNKYSANKGI
jgi:tRNA threonylcarbamoyladenosine biosynthesis protein TsaB